MMIKSRGASPTFHADHWPFPEPSLLVSFFTSMQQRRVSRETCDFHNSERANGDILPLTSSRNFGSVGFPFDEVMLS